MNYKLAIFLRKIYRKLLNSPNNRKQLSCWINVHKNFNAKYSDDWNISRFFAVQNFDRTYLHANKKCKDLSNGSTRPTYIKKVVPMLNLTNSASKMTAKLTNAFAMIQVVIWTILEFKENTWTHCRANNVIKINKNDFVDNNVKN